MILPAVSKLGPTSASGAATPENTTIAEITTPITLSPTIKPEASNTPSCFVASGLALRSARLSKNQPTMAPRTIIKVLAVGRYIPRPTASGGPRICTHVWLHTYDEQQGGPNHHENADARERAVRRPDQAGHITANRGDEEAHQQHVKHASDGERR